MSKEKCCKCCKQIWYVDLLDKKWGLCPNCYEYCKPLFDDLKIKDKQIADLEAKLAIQNQAQRISELEEQLANSIRPKFSRQEHICGFAFGEIREYIVVAYLDNDITLCENIETSELEWCDNNFLVRTFEEAQTKLQQMKGDNYE